MPHERRTHMKNENDNGSGGSSQKIKEIKYMLTGIGGVVFLLMTIVLMAFFAEKSPELCIMPFGCFVLAVTLLYRKSMPGSVPLITGLAGVALIVIPLILAWGSGGSKELLEALLPYLGVGLFFTAGVCAVGVWLRKRIHALTYCTTLVAASCKELLTDMSRSNGRAVRAYCPIFTFCFEGKDYDVCDNKYSSLNKMEIGAEVMLRINPDDPEDWYRNGAVDIALLVMGILFALIGGGTLIYMLSSGYNFT